MKNLSKIQTEDIRALKKLRDEEIDLTDISPLENWNHAIVGRFYRPVKESVTIRIDSDVLNWFRASGRGYQTRMNRVLRGAAGRIPDQAQPSMKLSQFTEWPQDTFCDE